jgi:hypothetical protein
LLEETGYEKFRGKCHELSLQAIEEDPTLTLVRGHYYCPIWNKEEAHWWTVRPDGTIHDPSKAQFPSGGLGTYTPYKGVVTCEECGQELPEAEATFDGHHVFCSSECYGRCVGLL